MSDDRIEAIARDRVNAQAALGRDTWECSDCHRRFLANGGSPQQAGACEECRPDPGERGAAWDRGYRFLESPYYDYQVDCDIHGDEFWHEGQFAGAEGERVAYCTECSHDAIEARMSELRVELAAKGYERGSVARPPVDWEPNPIVAELPDGTILRRVRDGRGGYETRQYPSVAGGREIDAEGRVMAQQARDAEVGTIRDAIERVRQIGNIETEPTRKERLIERGEW